MASKSGDPTAPIWRRIGAVAVVVVLCAGCALESAPGEVGSTQAISSGTPDDGDLGVVALLSAGERGCSGTLVAPRVVVTAGHCVILAEQVQFGPSDGGELRNVRHALAHPEFQPSTLAHDIGVLLLDAPAPMGARPWPLRTAPMTTAEVGATLRIVGYGRTGVDDMQAPRKREGHSVVTEIAATTFALGPAPSQPCGGDSGGPAFMLEDGVEVLVGVTSSGDVRCEQGAVDTRVDVHAGFVQSFIDATAIGAAGLGKRCYDDANCGSGVCAFPSDAPSVGYCTTSCGGTDECPLAMQCQAQPAGRQCRFDMPSPGSLATSCATDGDCHSRLCAQAAPASSPVCAARCFEVSAICPEGFACGPTVAPGQWACFAAPRSPDAGGGCEVGGRASGSGVALLALLSMLVWMGRCRARREPDVPGGPTLRLRCRSRAAGCVGYFEFRVITPAATSVAEPAPWKVAPTAGSARSSRAKKAVR